MNTTDPPHVKIKIKNASRPLASYNDTLKSYMITKESKLIRTNTRIPDKTQSMSGGGSYHIPDEEYYGFLRGVYFDHIFNKKKSEHLTEKQLETGGAICIDIDMRFPASVKSRKYTTDHVSDLLCLYLDVIREAFQIDETTAFSVFVFEKSRVNCVEDERRYSYYYRNSSRPRNPNDDTRTCHGTHSGSMDGLGPPRRLE